MCKTKEFIVGSAAGTAGTFVLFLAILLPMIIDNVDAINENDNEIVHITTTLSNLDETIDTLDNTISSLDDKIDKLNLIICDLSQGSHC